MVVTLTEDIIKKGKVVAKAGDKVSIIYDGYPAYVVELKGERFSINVKQTDGYNTDNL